MSTMDELLSEAPSLNQQLGVQSRKLQSFYNAIQTSWKVFKVIVAINIPCEEQKAEHSHCQSGPVCWPTFCSED
jgi:hypothetical protein